MKKEWHPRGRNYFWLLLRFCGWHKDTFIPSRFFRQLVPLPIFFNPTPGKETILLLFDSLLRSVWLSHVEFLRKYHSALLDFIWFFLGSIRNPSFRLILLYFTRFQSQFKQENSLFWADFSGFHSDFQISADFLGFNSVVTSISSGKHRRGIVYLWVLERQGVSYQLRIMDTIGCVSAVASSRSVHVRNPCDLRTSVRSWAFRGSDCMGYRLATPNSWIMGKRPRCGFDPLKVCLWYV